MKKIWSNIGLFLKPCLAGAFLIITLYVLWVCWFGNYVAESLMARALPLSIVLLAIAVMVFAIEHVSKD